MKKALAVIMVSLSVLVMTTTFLLIFVPGRSLDIIYESTSALATVGLSRSFTGSMNLIGKSIIILTMYLGRIGPITMMLAFTMKKAKGVRALPEEKVLVG